MCHAVSQEHDDVGGTWRPLVDCDDPRRDFVPKCSHWRGRVGAAADEPGHDGWSHGVPACGSVSTAGEALRRNSLRSGRHQRRAGRKHAIGRNFGSRGGGGSLRSSCNFGSAPALSSRNNATIADSLSSRAATCRGVSRSWLRPSGLTPFFSRARTRSPSPVAMAWCNRVLGIFAVVNGVLPASVFHARIGTGLHLVRTFAAARAGVTAREGAQDREDGAIR